MMATPRLVPVVLTIGAAFPVVGCPQNDFMLPQG
jgi:hypothetical protein